MIFFVTGCTLALFCLLSVSSASALVDKHESCEFWAAEKECETNPNYMLNNCAKACEDIKKVASAIDPNSFSSVPIYDVVGEKDIHGNKIDFNNFQGTNSLFCFYIALIVGLITFINLENRKGSICY